MAFSVTRALLLLSVAPSTHGFGVGPAAPSRAAPVASRRAAAAPEMLDPALLSDPRLVGAAVAGTVGLTAVRDALFGRPGGGSIGAPYPAEATAYDPEAADRFYGKRLPLVVGRLLKLGSLTFSFNLKLLLDYLAYKRAGEPEGESWPNEKERAKEALALATQLGPTIIKLAQALSIRTDLIPEAYALELRQLQDAVPAFDSAQAKDILARELGLPGGAKDLSQVFVRLSDRPLAAASIGQVYKGTLRDGREVAVKVQRPDILDEIALDLHLLRLLTPLQTRISNAVNKVKTYPDDIALARKLVDEWGRGFVAETDYRFEAANTAAFAAAMQRRGLGAVTSPTVVGELSTGCVLVTEWVAGTRLDLDASPDVPRLCGVAINAYLTMLLDTGVLHCDPHPGNLLRTTDGKLCILDWGMTLGVPEDLQYSLIEFIAHVNSEDYEAMPEDFVKLGFTPADQLERVRRSNLTEGLSFVLRQLSQGGGGKKLSARVREEMRQKYDPDGTMSLEEVRAAAREEMQSQMAATLQSEGVDTSVMDVTAVMEEMQQRNREMFKVPPYILYVARAFSTLEGIGLTANEDYSIVSEAFPYLSQRLLTDNSPRAKAALRSMVVGSEGGPRKASLVQLVNMGQGFTSYTAATNSAPDTTADAAAGAAADASAGGVGSSSSSAEGAAGASSAAADAAAQDQLVDLLLSEDASYVQELLLEEAAKLADAAVRGSIASATKTDAAASLAEALRAPKALADATVGRLPLPAPLKDAAIAPASWLSDLASLVPTIAAPNDDDEALLASFGELWDKLQEGGEGDAASSADADEQPPPPTLPGGIALPTLPKVPPALQSSLSASPSLLEELADNDSRLRRRLPQLGSLSRRFGATLLRRVAHRLEDDAARPEAPPLARTVATRAAAADRSLADLIEPAKAGEAVAG